MKSHSIEGLVSPSELKPFFRINMLNSLMEVLKLNSVNSLYQHTAGLSGIEFVTQVLEHLEITYDIDERELAHIPKDGSFVSISNHPYGGVDGLILIHILRKIRPDIKVLTNHLLSRIKPLDDLIIPVNPFEKNAITSSDILQIRKIIGHVDSGRPLAMFPAGQVSTFNFRKGRVEDIQWNSPAMKMIRKLEVPVVPIYFGGGNSIYFYILSAINPKLRTAKLPSELFNKHNRTIKVRIGRPISPDDQKRFYAPADFEYLLRTKTYTLRHGITKKTMPIAKNVKSSLIENIIPAQERVLIRTEIAHLPAEMKILSSGSFDIFLCPVASIPIIINEIGRLREETFRDNGEGTNQQIDLDHHDMYYRHLFIWDRTKGKIAGAYRIGLGDEIMDKYGVSGFYLQSLFRMKSFSPEILASTLELGRSFVVKDYQQKSICLHLLWKGLFKFIVENARYKHVLGPVSISNRYSKLSKSLIVTYLQAYHFNNDLAYKINPRKIYKPDKSKEMDMLGRFIKSDLNKLDKLVADIESDKGVPVLLKKYLGQNASVLGFNVDPKFSHVVDCLMMLNISDIPENTIDQLGREITNIAVFQRFYQEKYFAYNFIPQY